MTQKFFINIFLLSLLGVLFACQKNDKPVKKETPKTVLDTIRIYPPTGLQVDYTIDSIRTKTQLDSFNANYNEKQREIIYALNRIDQRKVWAGTELIIPDTLSSELMDYSPFPMELGMVEIIPKLVIISQRVQAFALYENGNLIKWGPASSGKSSSPTPNGLHYGNYKARRKVSSVNSDWILPFYFNFMNFEGVGTHQYSLPGYPASHACVRLYLDDARFIYEWAKMWELEGNELVANGTPFMVLGKYDYKAKKPWLQLADNNKGNDLNEEELQIIRDYVKEYKDDPKNFKDKKEDLNSVS